MNPFTDPTSPPNWAAMTAEHIKPAVKTAIKEAQEALKQIKSQELSRATYATTFTALEDATDTLNRVWGRLNHLDSVNNSTEQREGLNEMLTTVSEFYASISLDAELWTVLKFVKEAPETQKLEAVFQRHIEDTCATFINAGADLADDQKKRFAEVQAELSQVTQKFSENVLDSTNAWELILSDTSRLSGLPASSVSAAQADALAKGHGTEEAPQYRFTLQFPSLLPVMQYAEDETLRKELWEASQAIGQGETYGNADLVRDILKLRKEKADLLGFSSFADFTTERRMAKNGQSALEFVENLHKRVKEPFLTEYRELQDYKAEKTATKAGLLEPWETGYWSEKMRREKYNFDGELLRPYFPLNRVMQGMFDLAEKLFGVTIQEASCPPSWHEEVTYYELRDASTKELLGTFYADWHPRETKRGGAWMNSFETGLPAMDGQERIPHLGLICGNMTKPIGDQPALMTHNEVTTIFHEFGHLIHQLFSDVQVKALAGTNVAWDFVELPSQLMENFCWHRESLDFFARHHETEEPIPDELLTTMLSAKNFMSATGFMRQLSFGKLDLELHHNNTLDLTQDWDTLDQSIISEYKVALNTASSSMVYRFSHLFSSPTGYAAGYYSYKWAEVLDADAFTQFEQKGLLNTEVGMKFRESILSKGNSNDPDALYLNFMGAAPSQDALLKREGLLT